MTDFLYPFLEADGAPPPESDTDTRAQLDRLLADLADSATRKAAESAALQTSSLARMAPELDRAGQAIGDRLARGGRLYTFGNGGSSTDAATLARLFSNPPSRHVRAVPAWSLTDDQAVVTALGNDVGFDLIFSRQLIAHSAAHDSDDIAIALSTSGNSEDLLRGVAEAKRRGMLTIAFSGYDGGQLATSDAVDHCFTVDSQSIHRIQESQALIGYRLWTIAHATLKQTRARKAAIR